MPYHLRAEGRPGHGSRLPADLEDHRPRLPRSVIFFPVLVSAIGVGLTFTVLMNPEQGLINQALGVVGIAGPGWLTNPSLAFFSVALVDVWKGVGLATVIYIAGLVSIPGSTTRPPRSTGPADGTVFRKSCCRSPGRPPRR